MAAVKGRLVSARIRRNGESDEAASVAGVLPCESCREDRGWGDGFPTENAKMCEQSSNPPNPENERFEKKNKTKKNKRYEK